jgi:hypothetical protein
MDEDEKAQQIGMAVGELNEAKVECAPGAAGLDFETWIFQKHQPKNITPEKSPIRKSLPGKHSFLRPTASQNRFLVPRCGERPGKQPTPCAKQPAPPPVVRHAAGGCRLFLPSAAQ